MPIILLLLNQISTLIEHFFVRLFRAAAIRLEQSFAFLHVRSHIISFEYPVDVVVEIEEELDLIIFDSL